MASGRFRSLVLHQATSGGLKHVRPVGRGEARGLVSLIYRQIESEYQLVPPLMLHSPVPDLMAAVWGLTRESFLAGPASRVARESVAATISRVNACPFCVHAHAMSLHGAGKHDLAEALVTGEVSVDPDIQLLLSWATATRHPGSPALQEPPFAPEETPHFIGTALLFHYINRMVHVFLGDSPLPAIPGAGRTLRRVAGTMLMGGAAGRPLIAGLAEGLQRPASPSDRPVRGFPWAAGSPAVLLAWQNFDRVVQDLGDRHLPEPIRLMVGEALKSWRGEDMGLSRAWVEEPSQHLSEDHRPLGRFALLVALASHQVDDQLINAITARNVDGPTLVSVAAWASAIATLRIEEWISASSEALREDPPQASAWHSRP